LKFNLSGNVGDNDIILASHFYL